MNKHLSVLIVLLLMALFLSGCGLLGAEETPAAVVSELLQETAGPQAGEPGSAAPTLAPITSTPAPVPADSQPATRVILDRGSPPADRCIVANPGSPAMVTVYLGPSTVFAPVAQLGNWAEVLNSANGWHQIQIQPGETGWVRETDVTFVGPCDHVAEPIYLELAADGSPWHNSRSILPGQAHRYLFTGRAGDRLRIDLNGSGMVNFALLGVNSGQPLKRIVDEDRAWEGILPHTQEYMLTVVPGEATVDYDLSVALQPAHPLVAVYDDHTGSLLGGYNNANWSDAETTAPALLGGEVYELFRDSLRLGQASGSAPQRVGGICPGYALQLTPPADPAALAVTGANWDPVSKLVAPVDLSQADRQALADLLIARGVTINPADLAVQQALGTDLDGDGFGEIIVAATQLKDDGRFPAVAGGDYVLVAVLMEIDAQQHAEPLVLDAYPQADDLAYPWRYQVTNVLDLNGDGQLEIVLAGDRWEGRSTTVYSVGAAGGSLVVLQSSCAE